MPRLALVYLGTAALLCGADADLILHHGKIVTVDSRFSIAQAVAVKDGRIAAVGDDKSVLAERGPHTRVIDLKGRTVLPGLFDCHVHALEAGLSEFRGPLPPLNSIAAVQDFIRAKARTTPKGHWIVVPRTFPTRLEELRMPTRRDLDVTTDHPVLFDASYVVIVNSLGLKVSGIDRNTPNPPGGEIVKDADGEPNGILKNAQRLVKGVDRHENFTGQEQLTALHDQLERYLAAGLTSVGERAVSTAQMPLWQKLKDQGRLPMRVVLTWRPDGQRPTDQVIAEINSVPFHPDRSNDLLQTQVFKLTLDGGMTIGTAYQRHPYGPFGRQLYGKTDPGDRGQLFIAPEKLTAIMRAARAKGWRLTTHDQGGGAVDVFLDTLERLDREKPLAPERPHLIHASFQSPEAIARMKRIGVLADVQAAWLYEDGDALTKVFGYDGMRYFYPLRSYRNAGIVPAAGSDHMIGHDKNNAVNPYNPFLSMWIEVARRTVRGAAVHPEERISREEALRTHTIWAAYMYLAEKSRGSLERGKLADMVVIDRDYLSCPEDQIRAIQPEMTILGGKPVYTRPEGGPAKRAVSSP